MEKELGCVGSNRSRGVMVMSSGKFLWLKAASVEKKGRGLFHACVC